jgi:hypothetical protein
LAVTCLAPLIVTVHVVPDVVSQPVQPVKSDRRFGVAVSVTTVALLNAAEQVPPQSIPTGLEVTVPPTSPLLLTLNVYFTVNELLEVAVPPGVVTVIGPVVAVDGTVV